MGLFDRLFGHHQSGPDPEQRAQQSQPQQSAPPPAEQPRFDIQPRERNYTDEQAIERYKYMLRTAPPDAIEQAHEETFAKLTPEQRQMVLHDLVQSAPQHEQSALATAQPEPQTLARLATRAEVRQPGTLVQIFGGGMPGAYGGYGGGFGGMGSMFGGMEGSLLGSVAGAFIGTMIADEFFRHDTGFGGFDRDNRDDWGMDGQDMYNQDMAGQGFDQTMGYDPPQDPGAMSQQDMGNDPYTGGNDFNVDPGVDQGMDVGGDTGADFGGDFGGGDFGGGDGSF